MRNVFIILFLTLFAFGSAPDDSSKPDGRMWANFGSTSQQGVFIKAAYVQGAIEGLRVGVLTGYLVGSQNEYNDALDNVKQCVKGPCAGVPIASLIKDPDSQLKDSMGGAYKERAKFSLQHASVLDIVHQMDKFYADYRNTPVCMIAAVQESITSLNGAASTELELEMMRKAACNP